MMVSGFSSAFVKCFLLFSSQAKPKPCLVQRPGSAGSNESYHQLQIAKPQPNMGAKNK